LVRFAVLFWRHIESRVAAFRFAKIFEKHELGYDVTVVRWSGVFDVSLFFQTARDPVQRFIGQLIGRQAVAAIEVGRQPAAHLHVLFTTRVRTRIKPIQQLAERSFGWGPMLLQHCSYGCTVSLGFLSADCTSVLGFKFSSFATDGSHISR